MDVRMLVVLLIPVVFLRGTLPGFKMLVVLLIPVVFLRGTLPGFRT
jgi:hypothetical protein